MYKVGDLVWVKFQFSSKETIGLIIDVDDNIGVNLKYNILMLGMPKILWYMESEILGYATEEAK